MTYRLAEEIRAELAAPEGAPDVEVSGDFWPPAARNPPRAAGNAPQQEGA
jgi:hypothetical protein